MSRRLTDKGACGSTDTRTIVGGRQSADVCVQSLPELSPHNARQPRATTLRQHSKRLNRIEPQSFVRARDRLGDNSRQRTLYMFTVRSGQQGVSECV